MAVRYIALCTDLEAAWQPRFERQLGACDWWISAEWAGIGDDDEAKAFVEPLTNAAAVRSTDGEGVDVDFGEHGLLRVRAIESDACDTVRAEHDGPDDDCERGLMFSIEGATGLMESVLAEAVQAMAIGMAGDSGWVLTPSGKWWDIEDGSWMG